jgi:hypothetical protein
MWLRSEQIYDIFIFIFIFYAELHKFLEVELGTQAPVKASFVRVTHFEKYL